MELRALIWSMGLSYTWLLCLYYIGREDSHSSGHNLCDDSPCLSLFKHHVFYSFLGKVFMVSYFPARDTVLSAGTWVAKETKGSLFMLHV